MRKILLIVSVILLLISCEKKEMKTFNRISWLQNSQERIYMVNDLINSEQLIGKTRKEIIEYLGEPHSEKYNYRIQEINNKQRIFDLRDKNILAYLIFQHKLTIEKSRVLVVLFDKNDCVSELCLAGFIT